MDVLFTHRNTVTGAVAYAVDEAATTAIAEDGRVVNLNPGLWEAEDDVTSADAPAPVVAVLRERAREAAEAAVRARAIADGEAAERARRRDQRTRDDHEAGLLSWWRAMR